MVDDDCSYLMPLLVFVAILIPIGKKQRETKGPGRRIALLTSGASGQSPMHRLSKGYGKAVFSWSGGVEAPVV